MKDTTCPAHPKPNAFPESIAAPRELPGGWTLAETCLAHAGMVAARDGLPFDKWGEPLWQWGWIHWTLLRSPRLH